MPNPIKLSQLKQHLSEETDNVATALRNYIQFAFVFWRWAKGVFTSTGDFTDDVKEQLCSLEGCGGKTPVNPDDEDVPDVDNPDTDNPDPPDTKPPVTSGSGCCYPILDKRNDSYNYWNLGGRYYGERTYTDLRCHNGVRYMSIKNLGSDVALVSNKEFSESFESIPVIRGEEPVQGSLPDPGGLFPGNPAPGQFTPSGPNPMVGEIHNDSISQWNTWPHLEFLIWGRTGPLLDNKGKPGTPLTGTLVINEKRHETFEIENNGYWMARLVIEDLRQMAGGHMPTYFGRDLNVKIVFQNSTMLTTTDANGNTKTEKRHFPQTVKVGDQTTKQPYLTEVAGIRFSIFNAVFGEHGLIDFQGFSTPLPYGFKYGDTPWTLFDERWLVEEIGQPNRCHFYDPVTSMPRRKHLSVLWTDASEKRPFLNQLNNWQKNPGITYDNFIAFSEREKKH